MTGVEPRIYRIRVKAPGATSRKAQGVMFAPVGVAHTAVTMRPDFPFSVDNVYVEENGARSKNVEIEYVQVANIILAAFASRHPICGVTELLVIHLQNRTGAEAAVDVIIEGKEVRFA